MTLSTFPNTDVGPGLNSIPKKSTAPTGAPGMWRTASVKTMKARPVPEALCNAAHGGPPHPRRGTRVRQHAHAGTRVCTNTLLSQAAAALSGLAVL